MATPIFGAVSPNTQGPAMTLGENIYNTGKGLLGQPIAGNGYGQNFGNVAGNGFGQVRMDRNTTSKNPYLRGMVRDIRGQTNDLLGDWMNQINGNSVSAGTLGGSRQGLAQGTALAKGMDYFSGNVANLMGGLYESEAGRDLQKYGMDQGFYGQQRGQDIGLQGQNQNFYQGQRGQDLAQYGLGSGMIQQGLDTQFSPLRNAASVYGPFTGFGSSTSSSNQGGGWTGALGGGLGVLGLGSQLGWWGSK